MPSLELLTHHDGVVEVRLNRPEKRNALSFQLLRELLAVGRSLHKRREIRAVILSGAGSTFCAGIDLNDLRESKNKLAAFLALLSPKANLFQNAFLVWRKLPVPVMAVLQGHCYGAGMQLALGADFRLATPTCELSIMEGKWGLLPDMGASVTLRGLIGLDRAKELCMTARVLTGEQALQIGLVSHVADRPFDHALQLAHEIAQCSPDAVAGIKALLNATTGRSEYGTLAMERKWQLRLLRGKNFARSFQRDKDPSIPFSPRSWG